MTDSNPPNPYLADPMGAVFFRTAAPIILMMLVNGSFSVIDAAFLGIYVGADALTAITSMFPLMMLIIAFSTWVGSGFASLMARLLGAQQRQEARHVMAQAMTLSLLVCGALILFFVVFGHRLTLAANNGSAELAAMSWQYMTIVIVGSPLMFILTINGDALRSEGFAGFMALVSMVTVGLNIAGNYLFIAVFQWGVAGSAYGTLLAQMLALVVVAVFRARQNSSEPMPVISVSAQRQHWREFLALGAPSSLNYIGLSLASAAILFNLQLWNSADYAVTVSAYGIMTRLITFVFLPLLGLSLAFQSIVGNNVGAAAYGRANHGIKIALVTAMVYCVAVEFILWMLKDSLGSWFVQDAQVVQEVSRILPVMTLTLFLFGPLMMISMFFQSIGDALRAAILGLSKTYLFALPLIFILPFIWGEWGIWYAGPIAEALALMLTVVVLLHRGRQTQYRFGLFFATASDVANDVPATGRNIGA